MRREPVGRGLGLGRRSGERGSRVWLVGGCTPQVLNAESIDAAVWHACRLVCQAPASQQAHAPVWVGNPRAGAGVPLMHVRGKACLGGGPVMGCHVIPIRAPPTIILSFILQQLILELKGKGTWGLPSGRQAAARARPCSTRTPPPAANAGEGAQSSLCIRARTCPVLVHASVPPWQSFDVCPRLGARSCETCRCRRLKCQWAVQGSQGR